MASLHLLFCVLFAALSAVHGGLVTLTMDNLDAVLQSGQVVFVAFCAEWCPFSRRLKPIFEEAAQKFDVDHPNKSVVWAVVDSVQHPDVSDKYFVNKYPTMKVFINGELISKEYRSTRSVEALTEFVLQQLDVSITEFPSKVYLEAGIDRNKRNVIAYFADRNGVGYTNLKKVASLLREDCSFWVATDEALKTVTGDVLKFRDPGTDDEQTYSGSFTDYDFLKQWLVDKCIPLVREVTFENVEELTEEGMPFLIFFRDPADTEGDKIFSELVARELYDQKSSVNALLADGHKFAHPLKHLGKTAKDLPVLAIDSFQHMFLFPDMTELDQPGKLRQFILDLHSGKLHKDFHETLDQRIADLQKLALEQAAQDGDAKPPAMLPDGESTPKPSVFKELKPSGKRYSLLQKTEL